MNSDHEITFTSGKRSLNAKGWGVAAVTIIVIGIILLILQGVAPPW